MMQKGALNTPRAPEIGKKRASVQAINDNHMAMYDREEVKRAYGYAKEILKHENRLDKK